MCFRIVICIIFIFFGGGGTSFLGLDSFSILFNHRSFQSPDPFSLGFCRFSGKKDPWKEWKWKVPVEMSRMLWPPQGTGYEDAGVVCQDSEDGLISPLLPNNEEQLDTRL